jgi:hypothetical protein
MICTTTAWPTLMNTFQETRKFIVLQTLKS